jgi:hypothetical protein
VVKPNEGKGSDGVKLWYTFQAAKDHFNFLLRHESQYDKNKCTSILCQEFLQGAEYVVDHVSRDAIHKTSMVCVYDKGTTNVANFIPFGMNQLILPQLKPSHLSTTHRVYWMWLITYHVMQFIRPLWYVYMIRALPMAQTLFHLE